MAVLEHNRKECLEGEKKVGMERCACCGRTTDIPENMPVSKRKFYIEGGGQLCRDCYYELYGPKR